MSALEREIIEKFRQLDKEAQQRVRQQIEQEGGKQPFDFDAWMASVQALQQTMRDKYGADHRVDVVSLLREVREEED